MIKRRIRHLYSLFFSLFATTLSLASHAADGNSEAAIIFDNTAGQNNAALITNMSTWRTPQCSRQDVLKDNSQNCIAMKGNNDIQVIQNDGTGNLLNMIGVNNSGSTSYENKNTPRQSYYFAEGQHLFDINEFRTAAANMTALSPSLDKNTYGVISFEQFIVNVANGKTMNGIVRVKVPLIVKTSSPGKAKSHDDDESDDDGESGNDDGESGNDDGNDDGEDGNHSGKSDKHNKSDDDGESGNDDGNDDGESSDDDDENHGHVKMCGEKPTAECGLCGPGPNTVIEAGKTVCGHKLPDNAQINVNGALLFDWVNCKTDEVIEVNEFPSNPSKIGFGISVPLNINPANVNASTQTMASIHDIKAISGNSVCADGSPCNVQLNPTITYSMIPSESKEMFQYRINETLTEGRFATLSNTDKFHLLFPSGYANGWSTALNNLGITPATWNQWGFNNGASGNSFTSGDIRNESFQDIPALMYTGGLISINHHTNISGLIYAPQAIEISQLGVGGGQDDSNNSQTCSPGKGSNDDGDDDGSDDSSGDNDDSSSDDDDHGNACGGKEDDDGDEDGNDDGSNDDGSSNSSNDDGDGDGNDDSTNDDGHSGQSDDDADEDGNDDGSNDDGDNGQNNNPNPPVNKPFVASQQYISGSIIVRNGFYFEAKKAGGVTLISNNPDTYSNIELDSGSEIPGNFQPYQSPYQAPNGSGPGGNDGGSGGGSNSPDGNTGGGNPPGDPPNDPNTPPGGGDNSILTGGLGGAQASTTGGTQWVEIRPQ